MTHPRYGRSHVHPIGQLPNIRRSDGAPEADGTLRVVTRKTIIHYLQLYIDRPDPIAFMPVAVDTSDRIYDDFLRFLCLFLHAHRESSALANEMPEESGHSRPFIPLPHFIRSRRPTTLLAPSLVFSPLPKRRMMGSYLR
jgi:hypothetical protein